MIDIAILEDTVRRGLALRPMRCHFCGLGREDVECLIASEEVGGFICDDCVVLAMELVEEHRAGAAKPDLSLVTKRLCVDELVID